MARPGRRDVWRGIPPPVRRSRDCFRAGEAVTFVGINHVGHFAFRFAQRVDHRVDVRNRDPRIVLSLPNQKRSANLVDVIKRRDLAINFFVVIEIAAAPPPARA